MHLLSKHSNRFFDFPGTQEALAYTPAGEGVSAANQKKLCGAMPTAKICTRKDVAMFATTGERVEGEEAMVCDSVCRRYNAVRSQAMALTGSRLSMTELNHAPRWICRVCELQCNVLLAIGQNHNLHPALRNRVGERGRA